MAENSGSDSTDPWRADIAFQIVNPLIDTERYPMNAFTKNVFAAVVLAGVAASPAMASVQSDVQQSLTGSGQIGVTVKDGVATLNGYSDTASKIAAERAALKNADVDSVINLVLTNG